MSVTLRLQPSDGKPAPGLTENDPEEKHVNLSLKLTVLCYLN